jgi:4-amino-4-deoxy-L-arabinose transferase-like glycosyltransferase
MTDKNYIKLVALMILLLAAGIRSYGITERGLFDYDEAWYLLEAKTLYNTGKFALAKIGILDEPDAALGLKTFIKMRGTVPLTSIKPGHTAFLFLGLILFGPYDYAGLLMSVISGVLTVFLVFQIGRNLFGLRAGVLAALFLAVSPFHILYSRSVYSQANGIFLVTLGAYLWHRIHSTKNRNPYSLIAPGIAIGWAFTCHFNLAYVPVTFMLLETIAIALARDEFPTLAGRIKRLGILGSAMAAPAAVIEATGQFFKWLRVFPPDYPTYLGQFAHRKPLAEALQLSTDQVPFWTSRLFQIEGGAVLILAIIGLCVTVSRLRRPGVEEFLVPGLVFVALVPPSILSVANHYHMLRNIALLAPALALLVGLGGHWLISRIERKAARPLVPAFAGLCLIIVISSSLRSTELLKARTSYREATTQLTAYMDQHGGTLAARPLSAWPLWYFYLSEAYDKASPDLRKRIRFYPKVINEGDFELIDVKSYYRALIVKDDTGLDDYDKLRSASDPIIRIANTAAALPHKYYEAGGSGTEEALQTLAAKYPQSRSIEIYDLRKQNNHSLSSTHAVLNGLKESP